MIANLPAGTTKDQVPLMLQALLADRVWLQVHWERKELPGFELTVAKGGLKMKESVVPAEVPPPAPRRLDKDGFPEYTPGRPLPFMGQMSGTHARITAVMQTMPQIARYLKNELGAAEVTDRTGLTGMYDFKLHFAARTDILEATRRARAASGAPDPPIRSGDEGPAPDFITAVQEQLGLKLDSKKVMADMIVVDRVLKVPTEN